MHITNNTFTQEMQLKYIFIFIFVKFIIIFVKQIATALHSLDIVIILRMYQVRRFPENLTPIAERGFFFHM